MQSSQNGYKNFNEDQVFRGKIIYLDQNIFGRIIDGKEQNFRVLKSILLELAKSDKIVIPFSQTQGRAL